MAQTKTYNPSDYGKKEEDLINEFNLQLDDARNYFKSCIKPRLDRAYKIYIAYTGDRDKEIKSWQANVFVPYAHGVVETLKPRILDARPEFTVQGRTEDDQLKASKLQQMADYTWEISKMDNVSEMLVDSALIYGTGFMQVSWKKDVRKRKFLETKNILSKKPKWKEKSVTYYDAPYTEWVDNYALWYDWRNVQRQNKQFWFKRLLIDEDEIKRRYPMFDKKKLEMAVSTQSGDLTDYASIRREVKFNHEKIVKGADRGNSGVEQALNPDGTNSNDKLKQHEVFEWWRPNKDEYSVMVNGVPILKGSSIPNPYDFKESPFIEIPYLKLPNEFEGYGIPLILESPSILLNMVKNQRLDSMTLGIHKMWIVNPLANINQQELVTRPFGIIYSPDPNGVKEVQFSDIKSSAYKEEELLKSDMRYASGVDDFSMGGGGGAGSATEVRHLRESTLERVRLFINHLGEAYGEMLRYQISMYKQFFTKDMTIRVIGEDGLPLYPLIENDDMGGYFDFKATVVPSIAGQNDVKKKQDMDLFQLLVGLPFVDQQKLTSKLLHNFSISLDEISAQQGPPTQEPGLEGLPQSGMPQGQEFGNLPLGSTIPQETGDAVSQLLGGPSSFAEASAPINLLNTVGPPPTPAGIPAPGGGTTNPRGLNMGGKVNTQISQKEPNGPEAQLMNRASNING